MVGSVDRTLAALAEPTRRGVVELLRAQPLRASEIADALATTRPAMSRHLRVLRRAGLVTESGLEDDTRARGCMPWRRSRSRSCAAGSTRSRRSGARSSSPSRSPHMNR
jgi:DNA-binding transcriptional ArsR family regulator